MVQFLDIFFINFKCLFFNKSVKKISTYLKNYEWGDSKQILFKNGLNFTCSVSSSFTSVNWSTCINTSALSFTVKETELLRHLIVAESKNGHFKRLIY